VDYYMSRDVRREQSHEYAAYIAESCQDDDRRALLREALGFSYNGLDRNQKSQFSVPELTDEESVGIWIAQRENGKISFVKNERYKKEFYRWARTNSIPPKSDKYRIALLGESVARGFLFDPYLTPASVLQKTLNDHLNGKEAEVVDLACLGMELPGLEKLCGEAMTLEPDMLVIFAGNNWRALLRDFSDEDRKELILAANQDEMLKKMGSITKRKTIAQINQFMDKLDKLTQMKDIPVVFIIPGFNLKGWKHNFGGEIHPFNGSQLEESIRLKEEIESAIADGDYIIAQKKAEKLIELDRVSSPGYEYLARCMLHNGNLREAKKNFETARDSGIYMPYDVRCCYSFIAQTIAEKAGEYQFSTVHLPEIFKETGDGIPGYDLFIDYCHLNAEGIRLAMKHTAECILPIMGAAGTVEMEKLQLESGRLSRSYFLAALHCAHHGQPYEALYDLCCEALRVSPAIASSMISYIKLTTRNGMWLLNAEMSKLVESGIEKQYPLLNQDYDNKSMDITLVQAITHALQRHGMDLEEEINSLRIREHKAYDQRINLLESCYRNTSSDEKIFFSRYEARGPAKKTPVYKRIKNVETGFLFIADQENDIKLSMTIRNVCENHRTMKFHLKVNGFLITQFDVIWDWRDVTCCVDKKYLAKEGVNKIRLIRYGLDHSFEKSRQDQIGLHDMMINNLYGAHCQIRSFTAERC
jgi:hypothetical protein